MTRMIYFCIPAIWSRIVTWISPWLVSCKLGNFEISLIRCSVSVSSLILLVVDDISVNKDDPLEAFFIIVWYGRAFGESDHDVHRTVSFLEDSFFQLAEVIWERMDLMSIGVLVPVVLAVDFLSLSVFKNEVLEITMRWAVIATIWRRGFTYISIWFVSCKLGNFESFLTRWSVHVSCPTFLVVDDLSVNKDDPLVTSFIVRIRGSTATEGDHDVHRTVSFLEDTSF